MCSDDHSALGDDRAVSPVVGVLLMVAVTVALAGVAGIFLFESGEVDASPAPKTAFAVEYDAEATSTSGCDDGSFDAANGELEIEHNGGDTVDVDNLSIRGAQPADPAFADCSSLSAGDRVTVGDAARVEAADDDVVRLVWTADNGDTYVLEKWNGSAET